MSTQAVTEFLGRFDAVVAAGQLPTAEKMLDEMLAEHPGNDDLLYRKFRVQNAQGLHDQAFVTSLSLSSQLKANAGVNFQILVTLPRVRSIPTNAAVEAELCRILAIEGLDCQPIWHIVAGFFKRRLAASRTGGDFLGALSRNDLFNATLRNFPLWDAALEQECISIRQQLLELSVSDPDRAGDCERLLLSIAMQCFQNEYVYYTDAAEAATVGQLRSEFDAGGVSAGAPNKRSRLIAHVLLMYVPPAEVFGSKSLSPETSAALGRELVEFVRFFLNEQALIRRYADEFLAQAGDTDEATAKIAALYDSNPYPRWTKGPLNLNVQNRSYAELFGLESCPGWRDEPGAEQRKMLVAGCGTGRHPTISAVFFPGLDVFGIDISASCLAYARMMAERMGLSNMRFAIGDIMRLDEWTEKFDIIECMGVLHHLDDPEAGLANLVGLLAPGGIIKLGYYSEAARENISRLRSERPPQGDKTDRDYVREIRHKLFTDPAYRQYADIAELGDFYSLSGASNVLLHEHEVRYSIPRLQQVLDDQGLQFLSFIDEAKPRFAAAGGQGSPFNLMNWAPLEEQDPKFFAGMYEFYCQKKA